MQYLKFISFLPLFGFSFFPSNKDLPLPVHEQGLKTISGSIVKCEFHELGNWGFEIFVGMKINVPKSPYIRFNFLRTELPLYEKYCEDKANVYIEYKAKSTELRPEITYWGQSIKAK